MSDLRNRLLAPCVIVAIACGASGNPEPSPAESTQMSPREAAHSAERDSAPAAGPLRPIMQQLGGDMTALTAALWIEDYRAITARASAIADHAPLSHEELSRIQRILGSDMQAFEVLDRAVHEDAVRLHEAARARQLDEIVQRLHEVQQGCVACHTRFRERLRTERDSS